MIERKTKHKLLAALNDNPVVLLHGARQTGKSTLIKQIVQEEHTARYITFDDMAVLSAAQSNPQGFISGYEENLAIDEVQRVPDIFLAIKEAVDKNRKPGKFILTGSANVLLVPKISESLAGRIEILNLYPFSQGELLKSGCNFIDDLFSKRFKLPKSGTTNNSLENIILSGGYPEIQKRKTEERRNAWFRSYINTILQRDIRDLANIEKLNQLPRLLNLFAARAGSLLNNAEISRSAAIPQTTLKRYISLLEATFMIHLLPAWSGNLSKRLIKTPKIYLTDTGLLSHLISFSKDRVKSDPLYWGKIIENFVLMELIKQISWSKLNLKIYYYRTVTGQEIDFIIECSDGTVVGIEVKAGTYVKSEMFDHLKNFADEIGKKFIRGIVLYTGSEPVPFAKNMFALPVNVLW